jgi:predicted transcriptional regulator of viral defense system
MKPVEFFHTHALFRREEFTQSLGLSGSRAPATLTKHLQTWRRDGKLYAVRRGVYLRLRPGQRPSEASVDPLLLASRLAPDAALAYHTALEALGHAQSTHERLFFVTWSKTRALRFQNRQYVPVRPRAPLLRAREVFLVRLERAGLEVRATSLERTVVDVLDRPDLAGGMEEVWRSLGSVEVLDFAPLARYANLVARPLLAARLGYVLETHARRWLTPPRLLATLEAKRPRGPVYMERRQPGRLVRRWNLVVPPDMPLSEEEHDGAVP